MHEAPTLTRRGPFIDGGNSARPAPLVLVADDNPDGRMMYAEYLAVVGFRVLVASHGEEALHLALLSRPDVILMDMSMPYLDGCEVTRRLRANDLTKATPVIGVTGFGETWREKMLEAGCNAFLEKPSDLEKLAGAIRDLVGRA